jgi:sRNA-binding protein
MRVKIEQITPCDRFNMVGSVGVLDITTLGVGNRLEIQIGQSILQTSTITEISKTESGVDVKTKNSLYQLTYL